jgi:ParB-like chromosome segregation protein Spo0J
MIKTIKIDLVKPNRINPNKMAKDSFNKLLASIRQFGILTPLVVRQIEDTYEIIDGEHRYTAAKELGMTEIVCSVLVCSDEDVKKLLLATTIKGKNQGYKLMGLVDELSGESEETLKACNLDTKKIERKAKYLGNPHIKDTGRHNDWLSRDEITSDNVHPVEEYKVPIVLFFDNIIIEEVQKKLQEVDKNPSKAVLKLLNINK